MTKESLTAGEMTQWRSKNAISSYNAANVYTFTVPTQYCTCSPERVQFHAYHGLVQKLISSYSYGGMEGQGGGEGRKDRGLVEEEVSGAVR